MRRPARRTRQHQPEWKLERVLAQRDARAHGLFLRPDDVHEDRLAAADHVHPRRAPDSRHPGVLRRQQRVRHPRTEQHRQRCVDQRSGIEPRRCQPDAADSVHALALPHRELDRLLARDVLDGELRHPDAGGRRYALHRRDAGAGRGSRQPQILRLSDADHGTGVQPHLEHAGQRLRGEVQARHRARAHHPAHHGDRHVRPDRPARRHGLHRRRHHEVHVWRREPPVREEAVVARDSERDGGAELLHRRARSAVRPRESERIRLAVEDEFRRRCG